MRPKRIVITGGPGTGKTSLVKHLEDSGHLCYHEIIRDFTSKAIHGSDPSKFETNPLAFVDDPYSFNEKLLLGRLKQFKEATSVSEPVVFFDRGMPDVLAYMDFFKQDYGDDFIKACRQNRYDEVVILPPWKHIYISDNERFESFEEATAIHRELQRTYELFNYSPITVPTGTIEERSYFIRELIKSME